MFYERTAVPARPELAEQASQFMLLERAVEQEFRPRMLAELQRRVEAVAKTAHYKNLHYLLLKAQRMAATKTEFAVFKKAA